MRQTGTIGIIGGGQLGQMLTQAAVPLGFQVIVLDPAANSPAAQTGAQQITKDYSQASIEELAGQVDYLTTEFEEGLDPAVLEKLGHKLNPAAQTIGLILDKLDQKDYLSKHGVNMGVYGEVLHADDAYLALEKCGKLVIKTRRGGYDGYGNRLAANREQVDQALEDFRGRPVYWEAYMPFEKELAVMVVRGKNDEIATYPVVETIQKNNICHEVLAPAEIDEEVRRKAIEMAKQVASLFDGAGAFGIEMFLVEGNVYLNEVAPRVHNSGHYTIEACQTSQFENHIRAITDMPLGPTDMTVPAAVMVNILGERVGPVELKGLAEASAEPHTTVHIYGKSPTKRGRKMGHITAVGDTLAEAKQRAEQARKLISI
jgi:phosphoribosylaminoimidazole carboxylase PurK protein